MRRILCLALALLLCFTMVGATAELKLMSELDHDDYRQVRWAPAGSGLLEIPGKSGYYLANIYGEALTEEYGRDFDYAGQLLITTRLDSEDFNSKGALNADCEEVIPFEYGWIEKEGKKWVTASKMVETTADNYDLKVIGGEDKYYLTDTVDIYYMGSGSPECVASIPRENYADARGAGDTFIVEDRATGVVTAYDPQFNVLGELDSFYSGKYDLLEVTTFESNGQEGLVDAEGNVILEPSYKYIRMNSDDDDYFVVETGEAQGLIDKNGAVIVPPEYDMVRFVSVVPPRTQTDNYNNAGFFAVEKDGKLGYVAAGGEVTCEPKYPVNALDIWGASAAYTDMEGKQHILAADGVDVIVEDIEYILPADYGSAVYYKIRRDSLYGLIDFHGKEVLPCEYEQVYISPDGNYVLVADEDYNYFIYELDYAEAGAVAPYDAGEVPAMDERIIKVSVPEGQIIEVPAAEEAPAEVSGIEAIGAAGESAEAAAVEATGGESAEAAATGATGTASAAAGFVDSAILLLQADAAANGPAAVALLNSALAQLGDGHPASGLLSSAITLLDAGAAANGAAAVTLLESARGMM